MNGPRCFLIGFLLFGPGLVRADDASAASQQRILEEGVALYDRGDYAAARAKYQEVLAASPKNETACYELALTFSAEKNWQECIRTAELGLKSARRLRHGLFTLAGNCYDSSGQNAKAIRLYEKGLKEAPTDAQLLYNLALSLKNAGKLAKATDRAEEAVKQAPAYGSANLLLASLYAQQGEKVPALLSHLGFLLLESDSPRALGAARLIPAILSHGVSAKSETETTLTVSAGFGDDSKALGAADLGMLMFAAGQSLPENKDKSEFEKLHENLSDVLAMFAEMHLEAEASCFACAHFLPSFIELQRAGLLEPFLYTAIAPLALAGTSEWASAHADGVRKYAESRPPRQAP